MPSLKKKIRSIDKHTLEVVLKSSKSLIVKVLGMLAGIGVSIFLGRSLGASGVGIINLSNQIINLLLIFSILGFDRVIIREVAISRENNNLLRTNEVMNTAFIINGITGIACTAALIVFADYISTNIFEIPDLKFPLIIAALVFTPQIISRIISSGLIGYKKIWQSNLVDQTLSLVVIGILLAILWYWNYNISVINVAIIYAIGRIFVTATIATYWFFMRKSDSNSGKMGNFIGKEMMRNGLPLLMVSAALLISTNADTIMLGWLSSSEEVGLYSIAVKIALLTSFLLQIVVSSIAPKIAVMYKNGQIVELQLLIQRVTSGLAIIGLLFLTTIILFGKEILGIWGSEFVAAYPALIILSVGQFSNIASGPVGNILIMTNHEKIIRNITALTVLLNVILNLFLIGKYGSIGAACATSFTTILNMLICIYYVKTKTKISMFKIL
ncbi:flippase [Algoriphagus halophytocola]|uniref:Flippase n=1 Tax=Algoriphagus halophytocola TaxID=2991499 RepID=A0ABY6MJP8_9BACT|nr:flippase [Algoriphagus sp. TR-M5]UZD23868.1 flippase [Algoriphagus sp. TR-M5]